MIDEVDETYGDDAIYETATDEAVQTTTSLFRPLTEDEQTLLKQMHQWADETARRPLRRPAAAPVPGGGGVSGAGEVGVALTRRRRDTEAQRCGMKALL
jgi:hypothetical protein